MTKVSQTPGDSSETFELVVDRPFTDAVERAAAQHDSNIHLATMDADATASLTGLTVTLHEGQRDGAHGIIRMCCGNPNKNGGKCDACSPSNCEIEVDPMAPGGAWKIVIPAARGKALTQIELVGGKTLPVLDPAESLPAQLQRWHDVHFPNQERIYVLYKVAAGDQVPRDAPAMRLAGQIIAVPLEPKKS